MPLRLFRPASLALILAAGLCEVLLLRPLLSETSPAPHQARRAYFEPAADRIAVRFDDQRGGYMTDLALDDQGDLVIPGGRTIAVPLAAGAEFTVRSAASELAPYVVIGHERALPGERGVTELADGLVLGAGQAGASGALAWDAGRPWRADQRWLHDLYTGCRLSYPAEVTVRSVADGISIAMGSCAATLAISEPQVLVIVTGQQAATVTRGAGAWQQQRTVAWGLVGAVALQLLIAVGLLGAGPTALAAGVLLALGRIVPAAAILAWAATIPLLMAAGAARLFTHFAARRSRSAPWLGAFVLVLEIAAAGWLAVKWDIGTFGHERITLAGDNGCSMVGYSTVRGDSLRERSSGVVERLNDACPGCRGRTARFSREAQTLRWVRQTVCAASFPAPRDGEVIFLGGGNDDLFYRSDRALQRLIEVAGMLRFMVQPLDAGNWQTLFEGAGANVREHLDDQIADIEAIARCAGDGGRRLWFIHDFLVWDLGRGRTEARQQSLAARRQAVLAQGGQFIDLFEQFGESAGIAWFNDFIHPSAVGQQAIADLLCKQLGAAR